VLLEARLRWVRTAFVYHPPSTVSISRSITACQHRQTEERLPKWTTHRDSYTRPQPTSSQCPKLMTYEANSQCAPTTMGFCQRTRSGCLRVSFSLLNDSVSGTDIRCVSAARNTQTGETCAVKKVTNVFTKKVGHVLCPQEMG
jgi:hypothetical protein